MPGRKDFGILRSSFHGDARAQRAADLYFERGFATEEFAPATVAGHVVQLGLWAMLQTDDGILPGDGVAAFRDATRMNRETCRSAIAALTESGLLRAVDGGLYLVGFEDCYRPIIGRREQNRKASEVARKKEPSAPRQHDVSVTDNADVSTTSAPRQHDVSVTEPTTTPEPRHADVMLTSAPTVPCRAVPSRTGPERTEPHRAVPSVVADAPNGNGNGGGDSPSAPHDERNGNGATITPDDLGVFETLWRLRGKMLNADCAECERLAAGCREKKPDAAAIVAFVDKHTPKFVDEVSKTRKAFRMGANARKDRK